MGYANVEGYEPRLVVVEGVEWTHDELQRGWRDSKEYKFLDSGKVRPKDVAWTLRPGDQIFMKNTKAETDHPIYESCKRRIGTNTWFNFEVEETEIDGVQGLLLICTSVRPLKSVPKAKAMDNTKGRPIITRQQWDDAMNFAKEIC